MQLKISWKRFSNCLLVGLFVTTFTELWSCCQAELFYLFSMISIHSPKSVGKHCTHMLKAPLYHTLSFSI